MLIANVITYTCSVESYSIVFLSDGKDKKINIIEESAEELLALSRKVKNPLAQARLRAYYLYKTGQSQDYAGIVQQLGYERHAVGR